MQEDRKSGTVRVAAIITTITVVCKILGFLKNSVLAYYFGAGPVVDAYVMAFSIGTITCGWIAGLIGNFTPVYKKIEVNSGKDKAIRFAGNVHNYILLLIILLAVILEFIAPLVVNIVAPGFDAITHGYTVWFFRLYLISIAFYASYRFAIEFLNCNQRHIWASAPDILMSSCCIIAIVLSNSIGESFLIYGYVIAIILQCLLTQYGSHRIGFKIRNKLYWDENMKMLIVMAVPIFLSNTLAEINTLIDKIFASNLASGTVAALDYANTMKEFAYQLGTIAIVTIMFPIISKIWADGEIEEFKNKVMSGIEAFSVFYIPLIAGIIASGDLIISIVFKRGEFGDDAAVVTTNAFIIYSVALIALALRSLFFKAFCAMQRTKYIFIVSGANVILNILLNLILVSILGYVGLALATSLAALVCLPVYFVLFKKAVPTTGYNVFFRKSGKALVASGVMYICIRTLRELVFNDLQGGLWRQVIALIVITVAGVIIYAVIGYFLKIEEVSAAIAFCKRKITRFGK